MEKSDFLKNLNDNVINYNGKNTVTLSLPLTLQLEITSLCNMKCSYCYNSSGRATDTDLKIDQWKIFLKQVALEGGVFQCTFSGGEPLLFENIFDLMDIMHEDGTCLSLITNGTYMDYNMVNRLKKYRWYWIQVSLDSEIEEVHDNIRGYKGGWKKAVEAIKLLKNNSFPVHVAAVVTRTSLINMKELTEFCISLGVDKLRLSEVLYSGKACDTDLCFNANEERFFIKKVSELRKDYAESIEIELATSHNVQLKNCRKYAPLSLIIRPNGDVKIDCVLPYVLGNVIQEPISVIWQRVYDFYDSQPFKDYIEQSLAGNVTIRNNFDSDVFIN